MSSQCVSRCTRGRTEQYHHSRFLDHRLGLSFPEGAEESGVVGGSVFASDDEATDGVPVFDGELTMAHVWKGRLAT